MAFLHLVKVVHDVFEDKCQIGTRCSEAKHLYIDLNGLYDLRDISTSMNYKVENNQYNQEGIFQNNEKSSEIENKTQT